MAASFKTYLASISQ